MNGFGFNFWDGSRRTSVPVILSVNRVIGSTDGDNFDYIVRVTGTATRITVGGTDCTSLSQVGEYVTCRLPAKAAGLHDVVAWNEGGASAPLTNGYRAVAMRARYRPEYATLSLGRCASWLNGSGVVDTNRNAVQAVTGAQPLYVQNSANFNLKPTFSFDTGDHLVSGVYSASLTQPCMIYVVASHASSGTRFSFDALTASEVTFYSPADAVTMFAGNAIGAGTTWLNTPKVLCGHFNGASSSFWVNKYGTATATGNSGTNFLTGITIGASYALGNKWGGEIADIILCPGTHTAAEIQSFMTDLGAQFNIAIAA